MAFSPAPFAASWARFEQREPQPRVVARKPPAKRQPRPQQRANDDRNGDSVPSCALIQALENWPQKGSCPDWSSKTKRTTDSRHEFAFANCLAAVLALANHYRPLPKNVLMAPKISSRSLISQETILSSSPKSAFNSCKNCPEPQ